jgi:hypothetical protein
MNCQCGAAACRGTVTGRDWRLPQLQHAYSQHWSPPLLDRINAENASPGTGNSPTHSDSCDT